MRDPSMGRALRFAPGQLHYVPLSKIGPGDLVEPGGSIKSAESKNKKATARVAFVFLLAGRLGVERGLLHVDCQNIL
jgi:hypothetical protein